MVRHANVVELMNDVSDRIKRRACRVAAPRQRQPVLVGRTGPYLARQLSTKDAWQSTEGYPAMIDLSVGVRVFRNRTVTQGVETVI